MKRIKYIAVILLLFVFLPSCSKTKKISFADGMFVKLSYTPVNPDSEEKEYTLNMEVYQDGNVYIYADNFTTWYGEDEPGRINVSISDSDIEKIKKAIVEEKLTELHNDVGYKDDMDGVRKEIIIYTKTDEHRIYGLNPSNRSFNRVYDMIYDIEREEIATYISKIDTIQKKGKKNDVGIYITDTNDNKVFEKEDIINVYAEEYIRQDSELTVYRIVFEIGDLKKEELNGYKMNIADKGYISFNLYNDRIFFMTLITTGEDDNRLYSVDCYSDEQEAENVIKELKEGLE